MLKIIFMFGVERLVEFIYSWSCLELKMCQLVKDKLSKFSGSKLDHLLETNYFVGVVLTFEVIHTQIGYFVGVVKATIGCCFILTLPEINHHRGRFILT